MALTVLCIIGFALFMLRPRRRNVTLRVRVASLALVLLLPMDLWVLRPLENRFSPAPLPQHVDGVVVLGGAISAAITAGWPSMVAWPVAYRTTNEGWQTPLQPMGAKLAALDLAAHEWAGLIAYRLQGRTDRLLPGP